jgi:hypothetical protein
MSTIENNITNDLEIELVGLEDLNSNDFSLESTTELLGINDINKEKTVDNMKKDDIKNMIKDKYDNKYSDIG